MFGEFAGEMHGPERMLEAAMLGGWIDPARALQLVNIAEPLHPGRVDQSFFGDFALLLGHGKLNVAMDRIGDQRRAVILIVDQLAHVRISHAVSIESCLLSRVRKSNAQSTGCRFFPSGFYGRRPRQFPAGSHGGRDRSFRPRLRLSPRCPLPRGCEIPSTSSRSPDKGKAIHAPN